MKDKEKAWKAISIYVRERDAIKTTGTPERVRCFTCPTVLPVKEAHAGHFIDGRRTSFMLDERQLNAQCPTCNMLHDGNKEVYMQKMLELYGKKAVTEMVNARFNMSFPDLEELASEYKKKREVLREKYRKSISYFI